MKGAECSLGPHGHRTPGGPLSRHVAAMPDVGWGTGVAKTAVDSRAPSSPRREARPRPPCAVLMLGTTFGIQLGARLAGHHYAFLSAGRQQPKRRHTYFVPCGSVFPYPACPSPFFACQQPPDHPRSPSAAFMTGTLCSASMLLVRPAAASCPLLHQCKQPLDPHARVPPPPAAGLAACGRHCLGLQPRPLQLPHRVRGQRPLPLHRRRAGAAGEAARGGLVGAGLGRRRPPPPAAVKRTPPLCPAHLLCCLAGACSPVLTFQL